MNVAYDLQAYSFSPHGGIARMFDEMLSQFAKRSDFKALLLRNGPLQRLPPTAPNIGFTRWPALPLPLHKYVLIGSAYSRLERAYWKTQGVDLYHPTFYPFHDMLGVIPCVVNVYDLIHERFEGADDMPDRSGFLQRKAKFIRKAARIICISEATKNDLLKYHNVDPSVVRVVHLGRNPVFRRMTAEEARAKTEKILGRDTRPFMLYVGSRQRYKNFHKFIRAYGLWNGRKDVDVIVVGGTQRAEDRVVLDLSGSPDRVRFIGHTDDETLCALYNRAAFFAYPSSCEGFGIPVLEALAAGCPLCLSDIPVFHEIAGDLAAYFDPDSPESAAQAFDRALALRTDAGFASLSIARADAFSWKTCTDRVWEIYKELA